VTAPASPFAQEVTRKEIYNDRLLAID